MYRVELLRLKARSLMMVHSKSVTRDSLKHMVAMYNKLLGFYGDSRRGNNQEEKH